MRPVKLVDLIKTVADMRESYDMEDEEAIFIKMYEDNFRRKPRIEMYYIDDDHDLEVTIARVFDEAGE